MIDKLTPRWAPYERGDVVVFRPPATWASPRSDPYIKRVIGLPGDQIEIRDGQVFVNGVVLVEGYLVAAGGEPVVTEPEFGEADSWTVPIDGLFVLGDNRDRSADSRTFGPIRTSDVIGRAWLRYWPLDAFGTMDRPAYPETTAR
jgi:signal peptidase I